METNPASSVVSPETSPPAPTLSPTFVRRSIFFVTLFCLVSYVLSALAALSILSVASSTDPWAVTALVWASLILGSAAMVLFLYAARLVWVRGGH